MGYTTTARKLYTMAQVASLPAVNEKGWACILPVTSNAVPGEERLGNWIGWTVKGATW